MPESGSDQDWNQLIRDELPSALRLAVRLCGNVHDAEDLVQETVLRAVRSLHMFRRDSSFRTWFFRILINAFRSFHARQRHEQTGPDTLTDLPDRQPDLADKMDQQETGSRVAEEVSLLPERQREVLVLIVYEAQSAAEVAEMLGITVQNVYSNLSAARATLKQRLTSLNVVKSYDD